MQGKANFRGHPFHLMLVSFPIAFWTGTLFTDVVGAFGRDPFWSRMSVVLIAMGTACAIPTAVSGYVDYRTVRLTRRARRVATRHLLWSLGATVVYGAALGARWHDPGSPLGIAFTIAGALVLLVGGYFGSELSSRFRVGVVDPPPFTPTRARP